MDIHQNARLTPRSRAELVRRVLVIGQAPKAVAEAFGVNVKTVNKWCARCQVEGAAGLIDRSSRPHRLRQPTPDATVEQIAALRRQRWTGDQIARQVGVSPATVSRVLRRLGLSRLKDLAPAAPIRRGACPRAACGRPGGARQARRADPHRHQEARPLRQDRPPHHR
jgi:transposase